MLLRIAALLLLFVAGPAFAAGTFSGFPLASLPLSGNEQVGMDQGAGCPTNTAPCTTVHAPYTALQRPIVGPVPPASPFTFQIWWDTSTNPALYKVYNGAAWVAVYAVDTTTGIPSFPVNVYLPSTGALQIGGTTSQTPNFPITLFSTNTVSDALGVTANTYESGSGNVGAFFRGFAVRGTFAAPSQVQSGDVLAGFSGSGEWANKTNPFWVSGDSRGSMRVVATENWTGVSNNGTALVFSTTPLASATMAEAARLDGNGLLGIGTSAANFGITLSKNNPIPSGTGRQGIAINTYENATGLTGSGYRAFTARGTVGSPANIVTNDMLGALGLSGYWTGKTNAFFSANDERAQIAGFAAENWTSNANNGSYLTFSTTASGSGSLTERLRIQASGGMSLGTTTDPGANVFNAVGGIMANSLLAIGSAAELFVGGNAAAALATNATGPFVYISTMAGAPSGVPAGAANGRTACVFDTTNIKLWCYSNTAGAWKFVTMS